jgi:hypothetical protein
MTHSTPCPKCGSNDWDPQGRCNTCGFTKPSLLRLLGEHGYLDFRVGGAVGKPLLQKAVGDDSRFADHHQFSVIRDPDLGWLVEAAASKNPTRLQGKELSPGVPQSLAEGDVITVGASKARLSVEFIRGDT